MVSRTEKAFAEARALEKERGGKVGTGRFALRPELRDRKVTKKKTIGVSKKDIRVNPGTPTPPERAAEIRVREAASVQKQFQKALRRGDIRLTRGGLVARTKKGVSVATAAAAIDERARRLAEKEKPEIKTERVPKFESFAKPLPTSELPRVDKSKIVLPTSAGTISRTVSLGESRTPQQIRALESAQLKSLESELFASNLTTGFGVPVSGIVEFVSKPREGLKKVSEKAKSIIKSQFSKDAFKSARENPLVATSKPSDVIKPVSIKTASTISKPDFRELIAFDKAKQVPITLATTAVAVGKGIFSDPLGFAVESAVFTRTGSFIARSKALGEEIAFARRLKRLDSGKVVPSSFNVRKVFEPVDILGQPIEGAKQTQIIPKKVDVVAQSKLKGFSEKFLKSFESKLKAQPKPVREVQKVLSKGSSSDGSFLFKGKRLSEITDVQELSEAFQAFRKSGGGNFFDTSIQEKLIGGSDKKIIFTKPVSSQSSLRVSEIDVNIKDPVVRVGSSASEALSALRGNIQSSTSSSYASKSDSFRRRASSSFEVSGTGGTQSVLADNQFSSFNLGGAGQKTKLISVQEDFALRSPPPTAILVEARPASTIIKSKGVTSISKEGLLVSSIPTSTFGAVKSISPSKSISSSKPISSSIDFVTSSSLISRGQAVSPYQILPSPVAVDFRSASKAVTQSPSIVTTKTISSQIQTPSTGQAIRSVLKKRSATRVSSVLDSIPLLKIPKLPSREVSLARSVTAPRSTPKILEVFVRRKGKDVGIGSFKGVGAASRSLFGTLESRIAASGFIREKRSGRVVPISEFGLRSGFRASKVDPFRVVEKRKRRLSKPTEVFEIQKARKGRFTKKSGFIKANKRVGGFL